MKQIKKHCAGVFMFVALLACAGLYAQQSITITVKNNLAFSRNEVVSVSRKDLALFLKGKKESGICIMNNATGEAEPLQWIDYNGDKKNDELLFMATVTANGTAKYTLAGMAKTRERHP